MLHRAKHERPYGRRPIDGLRLQIGRRTNAPTEDSLKHMYRTQASSDKLCYIHTNGRYDIDSNILVLPYPNDQNNF